MARTVNVVFAGLGGQGVIKASDILAEAAFRAGHDVKKAEIHGMSQRGGSVSCDVRFGDRVYSPMVTKGEAEFLVVLEPDQVELNRPMLRPDGHLLGPELLGQTELPNRKALNVALLGALAHHLDLPDECWLAAIRGALPERLHELNGKAFELGRAVSRSAAAQRRA